MTLNELADKLEALDIDAFAALMEFEMTHDDEPARIKRMIIDALRFSAAHGLAEPSPRLDEAD